MKNLLLMYNIFNFILICEIMNINVQYIAISFLNFAKYILILYYS